MTTSLLARTRGALATQGIRPRKRLGQTFLIDAGVRDRIVEAAAIGFEDGVVEVGPGTGALTEALAERAAALLAIEVDPVLCRALRQNLGERPGVSIVCADALAYDFAAGVREHLRRDQAILVGNIPYAIASPLLLHLLASAPCFSRLLLMVQREVAERLMAEPATKPYGALTVLCHLRARIAGVLQVSRHAFFPRPRVDSAVIRLDPLPPTAPAPADPALFRRVVRGAFGQRRKTLRNALAAALPERGRAAVEGALVATSIDPGRRGETLSVQEYLALADALAEGRPLED